MSTELKIRAARSQDVAVCSAILNRWIDETEWMPRVHSEKQVVDFYNNVVFQSHKLFVAETAGNGCDVHRGVAAADYHHAMAHGFQAAIVEGSEK